jgi:hypothetical protein
MPTGPELNDDRYRNFRMSLQGMASEIGTATATAGAATLSDLFGLVTSESLTTAQNAIYTLTITNTKVAVGDLVFASVGNGTNTQGTPTITTINVAANSIEIKISNLHATAQALNGTLRIRFMVVKALS